MDRSAFAGGQRLGAVLRQHRSRLGSLHQRDEDFDAVLDVDGDGVITDYPLARRIETGA
ncbi:hypothetical protein [Dermabacter hominis]|uniref:hypothetical protein n=1 Tax=Dermabacter hominis TaxID=36740 RepID=UPI0012E73D8D|nr:hypothetical protein [Dermabacter hominis]